MVCGLLLACTGFARLFLTDDGWGIALAALTAACGLALAVTAYRTGKGKRQPHE